MSKASNSSHEDVGSTLKDKLLDACSRGNLPELKLLLSEQDAKGTHSAPLVQLMLQTSAKNGHVGVVAFLLDSNPTIEIDIDLAYYAAWGGMEVYKLLLSKDPNVIKWRYDRYGDAVIVAVSSQNIDFLRFLLDNGADPGRSLMESGRYGCLLAVEIAALRSTEEVVRLLIRHGAIIAQTDALKFAAVSGRLDMVRCLLDEGADINGMLDADSRGCPTDGPALHSAVQGRFTDSVKFLLDHGADPDLRNAAGESSLMRARKDGRVEMVRLLEPHSKEA